MLRSLIYKEIIRGIVGFLSKEGSKNAQKNMQRRTIICAGKDLGLSLGPYR